MGFICSSLAAPGKVGVMGEIECHGLCHLGRRGSMIQCVAHTKRVQYRFYLFIFAQISQRKLMVSCDCVMFV